MEILAPIIPFVEGLGRRRKFVGVNDITVVISRNDIIRFNIIIRYIVKYKSYYNININIRVRIMG